MSGNNLSNRSLNGRGSESNLTEPRAQASGSEMARLFPDSASGSFVESSRCALQRIARDVPGRDEQTTGQSRASGRAYRSGRIHWRLMLRGRLSQPAVISCQLDAAIASIQFPTCLPFPPVSARGPPRALEITVKPECNEQQPGQPGVIRSPPWPDLISGVMLWAGVALVIYLCWLLVAPFLPALAFGFALSMLGEPLFRWLLKWLKGRNAAAFFSVCLICLTLVVPAIFLIRILVSEAIQGISSISDQQDLGNWRSALEHNALLGPSLAWLDSRVDLPKEAEQVARAGMQWLSALSSSFVSGSAWAITQMVTMVVVLFYFLRDQESILFNIRSLIPLREKETDRLFAKITETIRISLYGKVLMACIQGSLGGLIFWWLGLPAPALWGFVMALLSVLPVLGAFVIWVPAAISLLVEGDWGRSLALTAWGILIVHPVDNFLGPVLVGTRLRLHTLLIFFSVIGGLAAFGASGLVLGPVTIAVAVSLFDIWRVRREPSEGLTGDGLSDASAGLTRRESPPISPVPAR